LRRTAERAGGESFEDLLRVRAVEGRAVAAEEEVAVALGRPRVGDRPFDLDPIDLEAGAGVVAEDLQAPGVDVGRPVLELEFEGLARFAIRADFVDLGRAGD